MKLFKTISPLTRRAIVFLGLFLVITGVAGPRIISGGILFIDGFGIYGSIGKALIFGLIAFVLLARRNKTKVALEPWQPMLLGWAVCAGVSFTLGWIGVDNLLAGQHDFLSLVLAHGGLLLSLVFAALCSFGVKNITRIRKIYKREILMAALLAGLFYVFLFVVYALWQPLAAIVLTGVQGLLGLTGLHATLVLPRTLMFDRFGITVAEYCSGIESIALFSGLYAVVGLLDWDRINKKRYFSVFPLALFILCILNVVRVYGLILAGYYIDPQIAFSLFHTYAGMVFFILYSAAFWAIAYKYLLSKPQKDDQK